MAQTAPRFSGMQAFFVVWGGQVVSMLGTGMSLHSRPGIGSDVPRQSGVIPHFSLDAHRRHIH